MFKPQVLLLGKCAMSASHHCWSFGVTSETWSDPLASTMKTSVYAESGAKEHSRSTTDLFFDEVVTAEHCKRDCCFQMTNGNEQKVKD